MKSLLRLVLVLCILLNQKAIAQDIIKFKNGDELKVKVQEITPQEIKYKRFDNLSGPLITVTKSTVSSLQYENGTAEKLEDSPVESAYVEQEAFRVGDIITTRYYGNEYRGKVVRINQNRSSAVVEIDKKRRKESLIRPFVELTLVERDAVPVAGPPITQNSTELLIQGQQDAARYYNGYHGAGTGTLLTSMLLGPVIGLIPAAVCSSTTPTENHLTIPKPQLARNSIYLTGYTQEAQRIKSKRVWGNFAFGSVVSIVAAVLIATELRQ